MAYGDHRILHVFRAIGLRPFPPDCGTGGGRPRGTLTVWTREGSDRLFVFFDYGSASGHQARVKGEYLHIFFFDIQGRQILQLPEAERDLGDVRLVAFWDHEELAEDHLFMDSFEVYGRLPVPPPGVRMSTATARASAAPKVVAR